MNILKTMFPYCLILFIAYFIVSQQPHVNYPEFMQRLGIFGETKVFYTALALLTCMAMSAIGFTRLIVSVIISKYCCDQREALADISEHTNKMKQQLHWNEPSYKLPVELDVLNQSLKASPDNWYRRAVSRLLESCESSLSIVKVPLQSSSKVLQDDDGSFTLHKWVYDWNISDLPSVDELLQPLKMQADQKLILLRWLSSGAVLIGLAGALVGLGEAINLLVAGSVQGADLMSLEPLRYSFICSAMGVLLAFAFSLLKQLAEGLIDNHFIELASLLKREVHDVFFPGWESSSMRLARTASTLESIVYRLQDSSNLMDFHQGEAPISASMQEDGYSMGAGQQDFQ